MTKKIRRPQDTTLRNVRAANKRLAALECRVLKVKRQIKYILSKIAMWERML